jgi:probable rRNA maturation factor
MKRGERPAVIQVRNAQRSIKIRLPELQSFAEIACALAWNSKRLGSGSASIPMIVVTIISDRQMARLHQRFSGVAGPTDVLTFHHGEIVISVETARRQARAFGSTTENELRLYILHGLLHLYGFDDRSARARAAMHQVQDQLLSDALRRERRLKKPQPV